MSTELVGRDEELSSIGEFVDGVPSGAVALVLEGDAGMGKTTLWRAAIALAAERGLLVLQAQPVESEAALSFAGVGDLLDPVLDRVLEPLASVQRRALERALVLGEDEDTPLDPRAVRVALMNVLRMLAEERPVIVAIDDSQWLDFASSAGLAYGIRRYRAEPIGLLLSRRSGLESALLNELLRSPVGERFTRVSVGPLDSAALHRVISNRLGTTLPRPLLVEVHQESGGNPFYAIEIVRNFTRAGITVEAGRPLPVPESLHEVVDERLLALPPESREFLVAVAAHAHPTVVITEAASGVDAARGLAPALEAQIVELDRGRIRFTHPLLAAGAYDLAEPLRRREIHRRLADLLEDPEARAWQLAAATEEPDEDVAGVLEDAARHASMRGALRPAALLLDRAQELTPSLNTDAAIRRGRDAAFLHFESGDAPRAERQLTSLIAPLPPGLQRARALWVLARIRTYEDPGDAAELFLDVVGQAGEDQELLAAAHEGVSSALYYALERLAESASHATAALLIARELGDRSLEGDILISKLGTEALTGDPAARATAERAQELQREAGDRRILDQPLLAVAEWCILCDEHERATDMLLGLLRRADENGDESARPYLLFLLSRAYSVRGELRLALEAARAGRGAAEQSGRPLFASYNDASEALVSAELGDESRAREICATVLGRTRTGSRLDGLLASSALGHLELSAGAADETVTTLGPTYEFVRSAGIAEPAATRFVVDRIEALVELGERDDARETLRWYEENARRLERISALANCARCGGLLAAQAGDLDDAVVAFDDALGLHSRVELPLDRGRTLLALGVTQRRMKRRREARVTLEEALDIFERIDAALWAERVRSELKRISGRAATPGALTPAEERVAALVVEGKTNKEVAAALFLSDRTVEGHLAHIFGKLGIRHRRELADALQTRGIAVSNTGDSPVSAETLAP